MKDEERAIISAGNQEVASEFFNLLVLRGKTDEGQREMDGQRERGGKINVERAVKEERDGETVEGKQGGGGGTECGY